MQLSATDVRLDSWLAARRMLPSRARATMAIKAGLVTVNGTVVTEPARRVHETDTVEVAGDPVGYVGRGGLKLAAALRHFDVSVAGLDCLDVGASTGGFTDCLLQHGAAHVTAIDVGTGQLHPKLRQHPQVLPLEQTDARTLDPAIFLSSRGKLPDLAVVDVSFISLSHVLPSVTSMLQRDGRMLALVKPQFEVGRHAIGKGGIVRNRAMQERAVAAVVAAAHALGLQSEPAWACNIVGRDGNQEYFLYLKKRTT